MKNNIVTLILCVLLNISFSQNSGFDYKGRRTAAAKKEHLKEVNVISDITPDLWSRMVLPYKERIELDNRRKNEYALGYYLCPEGGYEQFINYLSVEISAIHNGKTTTAMSTSNKLTTVQKSILFNADMDTDINVKIKFKMKNRKNDSPYESNEVEGECTITVVPEIEAVYPGGFKELTTYLKENVINKIADSGNLPEIQNTILKFIVNEEGQVIDAKIVRSYYDTKTDKIIIDAAYKMPKWKPAENSKGEKVTQEISIPFGNEGGC